MAAANSKNGKNKRERKRSSRKRHVQQRLFRRGGKRRGAGRKSSKVRPGRRHARREDFSARHPLHVVLRIEENIGTLRRRAMYKAIREATISAAAHQRIRIVHASLQHNHVHMIVEAANRDLLARGLQGFQISAARHINRALGKELAHDAIWRPWRIAARTPAPASTTPAAKPSPGNRNRAPRRRGRVFADRYYVEIITSPTQAHRALSYCLNNWRKHGEDRAGLASTWLVDPFSSAILFPHWLELANQHLMWPIRATYAPLCVYPPTTWLLTEGWQRIGPISARSIPGSKSHSAQTTS